MSNINNYRPIALVTAMSKAFERHILELFLTTIDIQFDFKKQHSTDICIFATKSVIKFYNNLISSPVQCCLLDASKYFDKINNKISVKKMIKLYFICHYSNFLFLVSNSECMCEFGAIYFLIFWHQQWHKTMLCTTFIFTLSRRSTVRI